MMLPGKGAAIMSLDSQSTPDAPRRKDGWDKAKIILAALTPITLAALGFYVTASLEARDNSARVTLAKAERSARLNEGIVGQLDDIGAALYAEKQNGAYDLASRVAGITQLAVLAQATDPPPPRYFYTAAIGLLTEYVRQNAPQRRIDASEPEPPEISGPIKGWPGITADIRGEEPPRYRAIDIVWALGALQEIRLAGEATTGQTLHVPLTKIDFRSLALDDYPGLDLSRFDFTHSDFSDAFLTRCKCRGAIFHHANLSRVATWNADFRAADFRKANLLGSKWSNVDLTGSIRAHHDPAFFFGESNTGQPEITTQQ